MGSPEQRRSGRRRTSSKKYTVDAFHGLDLDEDVVGNERHVNVSDDEADDYDATAGAAEEIEDAELGEDDVSADEDIHSTDEVADDDDDNDENRVASIKRRKIQATPSSSTPRVSVRKGAATPNQASRGLKDFRLRNSKEKQRLALFGPSEEDRLPALRAHYRWKDNLTLPSRKADKGGFGGFHPSFYQNDEARNREIDNDWTWYNEEGGQQVIQSRQKLTVLDESSAVTYLPEQRSPRGVVMGPAKAQRRYNLAVGTPMYLNTPFSHDSQDVRPEDRSSRRGWLLNLGDKVQCAEWAPNQGGSRQFLAVSCNPLKGHEDYRTRFEQAEAPAYTPQKPYKSAIQIWEFTADERGSVEKDTPPVLRQVLCTEWGDVRSFRWCPAPRRRAAEDEHNRSLGLLAGLWGDGKLRVLDIAIPVLNSSSPMTQYLFCQSTAFEAKPPDTVFTCLTWTSAKGIAAGCANGHVAIYDLPASLKSDRGLESNSPSPIIYAAVQSSYILTICTSYPSRSNFLLTNSMAGYMSMTDLTAVSLSSGFTPANTVYTPRNRIAKTAMSWHDYCQSVLAVDDNYTLHFSPLRRFYSYTGLTRFKSPVTALAVSPVHPFILAGTISGEAVAHNPLRRGLEAKAEIYNQTWFAHEWRRSKLPNAYPKHSEVPLDYLAETADEDASMIDAPTTPSKGRLPSVYEDREEPVYDPGLVRLTEGYRIAHVMLGNADEGISNRDSRGAVYTTVYEAETAVTAVAWNPNIHVGGWCVAGMATGLLRVEDVATE
ncbi:hypothetical protein MBLNU457_3968t1 [Dothideomycetes sp. NU457]